MLKNLYSIFLKISRIQGKKDSLLHFLGALSCTIIFALYCSGRVGWFLMLMVLMAPVVSLIYAWIVSEFIHVSFEVEATTLSKGESFQMTVHVENTGFLPSPPINLSILQGDALPCSQTEIFCSVLPRQTQDVTVVYTAKLCGASEAGVQEFAVEDFLGNFAVRGKWSDLEETRIGVVPEIADIGYEGEYIRDLSQWAQGEDESENTLDASTGSFGGFPGYDHREYVPGDPIKRINWKLSAGREEMYVRLDEARTGEGITLILSPCFDRLPVSDDPEKTAFEKMAEVFTKWLLLRQTEVEAALGHARVLLAREFSVSFYYYSDSDEQWIMRELTNESDLFELARDLAEFEIHPLAEGSVMPEELAGSEAGKGTILFCTIQLTEKIRPIVEHLKSEDTTVGVYEASSEGGFIL